MRQILCAILLLSCIACKKNDGDIPDDAPILSLDSLKTLPSNIPAALYSDLTFINETTGFAITQGFIVKTTDGGNTWTSIALPTNADVNKIQFTDSHTGYIIGGDNTFGILLKTTDGGQNWSVINLNTLEYPHGMFFLSNNVGFITGKNLFIKTTDGGQTWRSIKSGAFRMFQDVKFQNNEGYATSIGGVYFKTSNGGISWDSLRYSPANYLYDIYFTGDEALVRQSSDSLIDLKHNYALQQKPANAKKLLFLTPQRSVAIGYHYDQGFYPIGDILVTNDGWKTSDQKTFSTTDALSFTAIAKMSERKVMILGIGLSGTEVMILNR